jgi:DNA-binding protein YbaB
MIDERAMGEFAAIRESFRDQMRLVAEAQQERANLTASASVEHGRVTVTVNADGVLIDARFAADIDDLSYDRIAVAVVAASREAATEVARRSKELMDPLIERRKQLPNVEDLIGGLGDVRSMMPVKPPVSMASPAQREQAAALDGGSGPAAGITESSW